MKEDGRTLMLSGDTSASTECGSDLSEIETCTIPLSDSVALRISSDTAPSKWKTASLQKGLRFVFNDIEMVGEGVGFGVPVLLRSEELYFSGSSKLYLYGREDLKVVRKEFFMNLVPRRVIGRIQLQNRVLSSFWRYLNELYMKHRRWRFIVNLSISRRLGVRTSFLETHSIGKIVVTYRIGRNHIHLKIDPILPRYEEPTKMIVLNEQGASLFRRYLEGSGAELLDKQIGAWERVDADSVSMTDIEGKMGFRLSRKKGCVLRRGREFINGFQDWAGLEYEINSGNIGTFEYEIETLGV